MERNQKLTRRIKRSLKLSLLTCNINSWRVHKSLPLKRARKCPCFTKWEGNISPGSELICGFAATKIRSIKRRTTKQEKTVQFSYFLKSCIHPHLELEHGSLYKKEKTKLLNPGSLQAKEKRKGEVGGVGEKNMKEKQKSGTTDEHHN